MVPIQLCRDCGQCAWQTCGKCSKSYCGHCSRKKNDGKTLCVKCGSEKRS